MNQTVVDQLCFPTTTLAAKLPRPPAQGLAYSLATGASGRVEYHPIGIDPAAYENVNPEPSMQPETQLAEWRYIAEEKKMTPMIDVSSTAKEAYRWCCRHAEAQRYLPNRDQECVGKARTSVELVI